MKIVIFGIFSFIFKIAKVDIFLFCYTFRSNVQGRRSAFVTF